MKAENFPTKIRFRRKKINFPIPPHEDKYGRDIKLKSKVEFFCYILTPGLICSVIRFTSAFLDKGKEVGDSG